MDTQMHKKAIHNDQRHLEVGKSAGKGTQRTQRQPKGTPKAAQVVPRYPKSCPKANTKHHRAIASPTVYVEPPMFHDSHKMQRPEYAQVLPKEPT